MIDSCDVDIDRDNIRIVCKNRNRMCGIASYSGKGHENTRIVRDGSLILRKDNVRTLLEIESSFVESES